MAAVRLLPTRRDHSAAKARNPCKSEDNLICKQPEMRSMKLNPLEGFNVVKKVGQGHMSSVFLAVESKTNGAFAVKVKSKEVLRKKRAFNLAATEKEILSTLDHPFLPSLVTHFESENHIFLAMEYCSGGDINLFRHSQPNKILSESALRDDLVGMFYTTRYVGHEHRITSLQKCILDVFGIWGFLAILNNNLRMY